MNTKEWINKANKKHNSGRYDYSKSEYINSKTKIKIICKVHGEFLQNYHSHLKGHGCKKCQHGKHKIKIEDFISRSNKIHNNKYEYISGIKQNGKVDITCPIHGQFEQLVRNHLGGKACKKCAHDQMRLTMEQFINRSNKIHNNKYEYNGNLNSVVIICPVHGKFNQSIAGHLKGYGCKKCSTSSLTYSTKDFVDKAVEKHNGKYDYDAVEYVNSYTRISITCPIHGEFSQVPSEHLIGHGCAKCAIDGRRLSIGEFIGRSVDIHDNKYKYDLIKFRGDISNCYDNVTIVCHRHGEFEQSISNHLAGHGCPSCPTMISTGHSEVITFIESIDNSSMRINDRSAIKPYELDILLVDKNVAIEYNGDYWHSYDVAESRSNIYYHYDKHEHCKNNSIKLIQISEHEWKNDVSKAIIKSEISGLLGTSRLVCAEKCSIKAIDSERSFMDNNHICGFKSSTMAYGLIYNDDLISCMSFKKHGNGWEIVGYADRNEHQVSGGAQKLFDRFLSNCDPIKVTSHVSRMYHNGDVFVGLGFKLDRVIRPNYKYVKGGKAFRRQQFQKHKLKNKLDIFDPKLTEAENMFNNGYRRLWDAGQYKFIF